MDKEKIILILEKIPKNILIYCVEQLMNKRKNHCSDCPNLVSNMQIPERTCPSSLPTPSVPGKGTKRPDAAAEEAESSFPPMKSKELLALLERGAQVETLGQGSWVAVLRRFAPPASKAQFDKTWNEHPLGFRTIKMFGKDVELPRWQQAYGTSYKYSGTVSDAVPATELIQELLGKVNDAIRGSDFTFNTALCNWYAPEHYIGPHSDDTRQLAMESPIASLSWGRTRTFVLTPKKDKTARTLSLTLNDGDLVVMGGRCQDTHKHEILKLKKGAVGGNRVNFTFRCFRG